MSKELRVILICDNDNQADKLTIELQSTAYAPVVERVGDFDALAYAVGRTRTADIILLCVPNHAMLLEDIVQSARRSKTFLPVICIGERNTDKISEYLQQGASDLVEQNNMAHLQCVIDREMVARSGQLEFNHISASYAELENRYTTLVNEFEQPLAYIHDGIHVFANEAYYQLFNLSQDDELQTIPLLDLLPETEQQPVKAILKAQKKEATSDCIEIHLGYEEPSQLKCSAVIFDGLPCIQVVISNQKKPEAEEISKHLDYLILFDVASGLYSRTHFVNQIEKAAGNYDGSEDGIHQAVVLISIKNFSELASHTSLSEADGLYTKVGRAIKSLISVDDVLCRYDQSTFGLLISSTDTQSLNAFISRLIDTLEQQTFSMADEKASCKLSAGSAALGDGDAFETLTRAAQELKPQDLDVQSKAQIEPEIERPEESELKSEPIPVSIEPSVEIEILDQADVAAQAQSSIDKNWAAQLRLAEEENRYALEFKPIVAVDGSNQKLFSVEFNITTTHNGNIPESEFLPSAKRTGFGIKLDHWMLQNITQHYQNEHPNGAAPKLFIRLAKETLFSQSETDQLNQYLKGIDQAAINVVIQIHFNELLDHLKNSRLFIETLQPMGFQFAIEQSIDYHDPFPAIKFVNPRYLILDQELTLQIGSNKQAAETIRGISAKAHTENMKVVAKNVQNANQFFALKALGIDYAQGAYFQNASNYEYESSVMPD